MVMRVKCEGEWNSSVVFSLCSSVIFSLCKVVVVVVVTFVVLTVDQFVGRDDGPLEQQKQDSRVLSKKLYISSYIREKSESSIQRRRSLRN